MQTLIFMHDILTKGLISHPPTYAHTLTVPAGCDQERANCKRVQARVNSLHSCIDQLSISTPVCFLFSGRMGLFFINFQMQSISLDIYTTLTE